jgi:Phage integrase family
MMWRDVDLANGRFEVGRDKTDAGMREVDMLPLLREILTEHKAASPRTGPDDSVFVTAAGRPRSRHNLRQDVVDAAVAHAHRLAEERGLQPLPLGITPHKLRHTFASILVAIGKDPTYVMQQLGHTDPAFTLRVYAHAMRRSEEERARLKALVEGHDWSHIGHKTAESASARLERDAGLRNRKPCVSRAFLKSGRPDENPVSIGVFGISIPATYRSVPLPDPGAVRHRDVPDSGASLPILAAISFRAADRPSAPYPRSVEVAKYPIVGTSADIHIGRRPPPDR